MKKIISFILTLAAVALTAAGVSAQDYDLETEGLYLKLNSITTDTVEATLVGISLPEAGGDMTLSRVITYRNNPLIIKEVALNVAVTTKVGNTITIPSGINISSLRYAPFLNYNLPEDVDLLKVLKGNSFIETIALPDNLTAIPEEAFKGCISLKSISLPSSVTKIGRYAFSECSSLTRIKGLENVTSVGSYAFEKCSQLDSVRFSPALKELGAYSFYLCSSLSDINIGSVTTIEEGTFSLTGIKSLDFLEEVKELKTFCLNGVDMEEARLPDSVAYYPRGMIRGNIKRLRIGDAIKRLDGRCFTSEWEYYEPYDRYPKPWYYKYIGCIDGLKEVDLNKMEILYLDIFYGLDSLRSLTFPTSLKEAYFGDSQRFDSITVLDSPKPIKMVRTVDYRYFYGNLYLGRSLTEEHYNEKTIPFRNLKSVRFGNLVEYLPANTFKYCESLEINIPEKLRYIGDNCFAEITNQELVLPACLDTIGTNAFGATPNLFRIKCMGQTPPVCGSELFSDLVYAFATLEVPDAEAYRNAPVWKNFRNIVTSGIDDPLADPSAPAISVEEGVINVSGSEQAEIFTPDGRLVYRGSPAAIPALPRGIYIVRAGSAAVKLSL